MVLASAAMMARTAFSDDQLLADAVQHVLQARHKSDDDKKLQDSITDQVIFSHLT